MDQKGRPTKEVVEHHETRYRKKIQKMLDTVLNRKPLEKMATEELIGMYYAAKSFFVVTICLAFLEPPGEHSDQEELKASMGNQLEEWVQEWLRNIPPSERTFLHEDEEQG